MESLVNFFFMEFMFSDGDYVYLMKIEGVWKIMI